MVGDAGLLGDVCLVGDQLVDVDRRLWDTGEVSTVAGTFTIDATVGEISTTSRSSIIVGNSAVSVSELAGNVVKGDETGEVIRETIGVIGGVGFLENGDCFDFGETNFLFD